MTSDEVLQILTAHPATTSLVTVALIVLVTATTHPRIDLLLFVPAAATTAITTVTDLFDRRIPTVVLRPAALLSASTALILAATTGRWPNLVMAALAGAGFLLAYGALYVMPILLGRASPIGAGDARLAGYLGLLAGWLGPRGIEALAVVPYLTAVLEVLGRGLTRRRVPAVALGPHLVLGLAAALVLVQR